MPGRIAGCPEPAKIARPGTHCPAAICDVFGGHNNKAPPETCTTTIVDRKLILLNSFTHHRDQISNVKREKDWGASPKDPQDEPVRMVQKS